MNNIHIPIMHHYYIYLKDIIPHWSSAPYPYILKSMQHIYTMIMTMMCKIYVIHIFNLTTLNGIYQLNTIVVVVPTYLLGDLGLFLITCVCFLLSTVGFNIATIYICVYIVCIHSNVRILYTYVYINEYISI